MNVVRPGVLLIRAAAVLILIAPLAASPSERADCTALVSIDDDLFGVNASRPMLRYTRDGAKRDSGTISPDASFVVYNTHDAEIGRSHAHAVLASGGAFDLEVPNRLEAKNFLERMDAHRPDAIAVRYSGHNFGRFEWLSSRGELLGVPLALGSDCGLSRSGRVACIEGNGVMLDGGLSSVFRIICTRASDASGRALEHECDQRSSRCGVIAQELLCELAIHDDSRRTRPRFRAMPSATDCSLLPSTPPNHRRLSLYETNMSRCFARKELP